MELVETSTRKSNIEGTDRISSLPDDVLHKILSSLYIFDVVKLGVLSKRWKYIWTTMPYLHFEIDRFGEERLREGVFHGPMKEKFRDIINWALISQWETKLVRFRLCVFSGDAFGCENCEFKISFPNLKFLTYEAPMPKDIIMENLFSIEDVRIIFTNICSLEDTVIFVHKMIKEVASTSVLTLCNALILGMCKATSKERLSPVSFCKLKTLKLYARVDEDFMHAMILLLKYSPNLEVLQL